MRKIVLTVVFLILTSSSNAQDRSLASGTIKKLSAKDLRLIMDTTSVPLIVNFWATWCGPCIREIPWFDSIILEKKLHVKLLLVSVDFPKQYPVQLADFVQKRGYKGEVVFLDETNTHQYVPVIDEKWTGEIPASIFINNPKKYYQLFNQQLPPKRFELEIDNLVK